MPLWILLEFRNSLKWKQPTNFAKIDDPSNTKCEGVCLYYKYSLALKVMDVSHLKECVNFEVKIGDKTCNFVSFCRSPSQTKDEFENFIKKL